MLFLTILLLLTYSLDAYIIQKWMKYVKKQDYPKYFYRSAWILSVLMLIVFGVYAYARYKNPIFASEIGIIHNIVTVWYLPKLMLFPFFLIFDIFSFLKKGLVALNQPQQYNNKIKEQKAEITDTSRRKFTRNLGLTISSVPFIIVSKGSFDSVTSPKIHKVDIPIKNLPDVFNGTKIVQISDVHVGSFRSDQMFREVVSMANDLKPDIFINSGDFVNFNPEELELFHDLWKGFKSDIGTFSCLGNHDHYMSDNEHSVLLESLDYMKQNIMNNRYDVIEKNGHKLNIAGIDNYGFGQNYGDFDKALNNIDNDGPVILLCHDPTNWNEEVRNKRKVDLMLSGHTHGGQFGFRLLGKEYSPVSLKYEQWAGLYQDKDQYLYVNRGLGTSGFPVRVGMNPEITLIELHRK